MKQGQDPSLEEIAAEALVSRATAYRYFPSVEALLVEASFDLAVPEADDLFGGDASTDPVARLERVDTALHDMILANEPALRNDARARPAAGPQGRRFGPSETPEPPHAADRGRGRAGAQAVQARGAGDADQGIALIVGPEGVVVCKDVLQLDDAEARKVKRWAIGAMVEAAKKPGARQ